MAGNTRGKLKEHFEGIHKNFDWILHHVAISATLIENQLSQLPAFEAVKGDEEKEQAFFNENSMYRAVIALGEGVSTLDELAKNVYSSF